MPARVPGQCARAPLWLGAGVLLVAASLRLPISSVGPVLDELRASTGLSGFATGVLTSLPVICFGVTSALAAPLARRRGDEAVLMGCLVAIAAGVLLRAVPTAAPLFAGTLVVGVGIALANVLLPGLIKREYAAPGTMMGLYTMVLTASASLAAGLTVPLEHALGSWSRALAAWALPTVAAVLLWVPATRRGRRSGPPPPHVRVRLRGDRTAWMLTGLMGSQSFLFYVVVSWLPNMLRDEGLGAAHAGLLLSIALLFGLPGSLIAPMLAARMRDQRPLPIATAGLWALGALGVLWLPPSLVAAAMVSMGLAQGIGFGLSLTLIVLRSPDGAHAAALSGMVQSIGYLLAALGPVAVGILHDVTHGWTVPLAVLVGVSGSLLLTGLGAARPGMVGAASV